MGGDFDPAGLATDLDLTEMKRFREAEVTHGRVAMTAVLGFLVAESFHPLFGGNIGGPAIFHLTEVRKVAPLFFERESKQAKSQSNRIESNRIESNRIEPNQAMRGVRMRRAGVCVCVCGVWSGDVIEVFFLFLRGLVAK